MTKEEFIIQAQVYYYQQEGEEKWFEFLHDNVRVAIIQASIDYCYHLATYEYLWLINTKNDELIKSYYHALIISGQDELEESEFVALPLHLKLDYYEQLKKAYIEDGYLEDFKEHWIVDLILLYKADWRDKQINTIFDED